MALAIDASSPGTATQTTGSTATVVTGSFTPPAGSLLLPMWAANSGPGVNPTTPSITDNLATHLTYTLVDWRSHPDAAPSVDGQAADWQALVASSAAQTVTVTNGAASPDRQAALRALVLTGHDTSTPIGAHGKAASASGASIAPSYTATRDGSWGFLVVCDWDLKGPMTAGAGMTLIASANVGTAVTYGFFRRTSADGVNGSTTTLNVTLGGTSTSVSWAYVEILPAAGGGTTQNATAALAATASLTVDAPKTTLPATSLAATATFTVAATDTISPAATLAATATLTAAATTSGTGATATLAATATLSTTADRTAVPAASVVATATLTPAAVDTVTPGVTLAATATLTTTPARTAVAAVALPATATLTPAATDTIPESLSLPVTATLTPAIVIGAAPTLADTTLTVTATLSTVAARTAISATALAAIATLTPGLSASRSATAAVAVVAALAPGAANLYQAGAVLAVTAALVVVAGALNPVRGGSTLASATASVTLATAGNTARLISTSGVQLL